MDYPRETPDAATPDQSDSSTLTGNQHLPMVGLNMAEPNPQALADPEDVNEQSNRLEELSGLLSRVDGHVSHEYDVLVDASDDDTDPPHTSDLGESKVEIDQAYVLEEQAKAILDKPVLTNQDVVELEEVLDELDSKIESATPLSFVDTGDTDGP